MLTLDRVLRGFRWAGVGLMLLGLVTGSFSSRAAEGRRPIEAPRVITQPGKYILTQSIDCTQITCDCTTQPGVITIDADNVTLDLNHKTIQVDSGNACDVLSFTGTHKNFTLRNGTLTGNLGAHGIGSQIGGQVLFENVQLTLPGINQDTTGAVLTIRNSVVQTDAWGFTQFQMLTIENTDFRGYTNYPFIYMDHEKNITIRRSRLYTSVHVGHPTGAVLIENNTIFGASIFVEYCSGNPLSNVVIRGNRTLDTPEPSVNVEIRLNSCSGVIENNEVNTLWISLGTSDSWTLVRDNLLKNFLYDGLHLEGSRSLIENNRIIGPPQNQGYYSFYINGTGNVYRGNSVLKGAVSISSGNYDGGGNVFIP